ncbi:MAG: response regulator [Bacteroidales bacterium]|jgi:CheY-like chemotaxis protein
MADNYGKYRKPQTILYIDDDVTSRMLIREILCDRSIEIITAGKGNEGIVLFRSVAGINLVISDLKLPDMTGFEVLKSIRKTDPEIPVIAHSAYLHGRMKEKCMRSGFNEFIPKPVDIKRFLIIVDKYIS